MAHVESTRSHVRVSEKTLMELVAAVQQARDELEFVEGDTPEGQDSLAQYRRARAERGAILVKAPNSSVLFEILLDGTAFGYEKARGYRLWIDDEPATEVP